MAVAITALYHKKALHTTPQFILLSLFLFLYFGVLVGTVSPTLTPFVVFSWQLLPLVLALVAFGLFQFLYNYTFGRRLSTRHYFTALVPLVPIAVLLPTPLNVAPGDLGTCAIGPIGFLSLYAYLYVLCITASFVYIGLRAGSEQTPVPPERKSVRWVMGGGALTLTSVVLTTAIGTAVNSIAVILLAPVLIAGYLAILGYTMEHRRRLPIRRHIIALLSILLILLITSLFFVEDMSLARQISISLLITASIYTLLLAWTFTHEIKLQAQHAQLTSAHADMSHTLKVYDTQKSEFVSIASQELRQPLTAIRGYTSLLLEGSYGRVPKKSQEPLQHIAESAKRMALAIEEYFNISTIEAGNLRCQLSDFNVRDEMEVLCDELRPSAIKQGIVLLFRTDLKSHGIVHADRNKTKRILQGLLHNAITYTSGGSIKVLVWDNVVTKRIYIDITDTGIGMDQATIRNLFQKFHRGANARAHATHGAGLSLYSAQQIATAMGGSVTAHSEGVGKGARFTLELPLAL